MKNIIVIVLSLVLFSCGEEDKVEEIALRVNHYKPTAIGVDKTLVFMVQENEEIGSSNWSYIYDDIAGFDYEFGTVYDLKVIKRSISDPPADGSSIEYDLKEIISETKADNGSTFELTIKSVSQIDPPNFVFGGLEEVYSLLGEVEINCENLCDELSEALATEDELTGRFVHQAPDTIKLIELITP